MLAKPLNLILVYIVTIFNIAVIASSMLALLVPFVDRHNHTLMISDNILQKMQLAIWILLFLVSFFMLIYFVLDFLFGFGMKSSLKKCVRYETRKDYAFLTKIFTQVKEKFNEKSVKLYIKNSDEINAFAVSSLGGRTIVLTSGLIDHYLAESENPDEFLEGLRSIMSHEMSHLINKDFLPTFLIIANQKATNFVARLLNIVMNFAIRAASMMPYGGRYTARTMQIAYIVLNFFVTAFNRFIVFNLYEFLRRFFSRQIEYRCDRQAAQAFGGARMALALAFLGESGYFTLFSTHPGTKKRIAKVENIEISDKIIKPSFIDSLSNYLSIMGVMILCLYFAKQAQVDLLLRQYIRNHEAIHHKLESLWHLLNRFI